MLSVEWLRKRNVELFNIEFGFNSFRNVYPFSDKRDIKQNQYKTKKKIGFLTPMEVLSKHLY